MLDLATFSACHSRFRVIARDIFHRNFVNTVDIRQFVDNHTKLVSMVDVEKIFVQFGDITSKVIVSGPRALFAYQNQEISYYDNILYCIVRYSSVSLVDLTLIDCRWICPEAINAIRSFVNLEHLSLLNVTCSNRFRFLFGDGITIALPLLTQLSLIRSDNILNFATIFPLLNKFKLSLHNVLVDQDSLFDFIRNHPLLIHLSIGECINITSELFVVVSNVSIHLETFELQQQIHDLPAVFVHNLCHSTNLTRLNSLSLNCSNIDVYMLFRDFHQKMQTNSRLSELKLTKGRIRRRPMDLIDYISLNSSLTSIHFIAMHGLNDFDLIKLARTLPLLETFAIEAIRSISSFGVSRVL